MLSQPDTGIKAVRYAETHVFEAQMTVQGYGQEYIENCQKRDGSHFFLDLVQPSWKMIQQN